jgi:hypothetical protein
LEHFQASFLGVFHSNWNSLEHLNRGFGTIWNGASRPESERLGRESSAQVVGHKTQQQPTFGTPTRSEDANPLISGIFFKKH